jgi:hypothetical protein
VLLAASSDTVSDQRVAIVRRPNAQTVVVVSAQATPEDLLGAIGTIGLLRARHDTSVTEALATTPILRPKASPQMGREVAHMGILLERLRHAPTMAVEGVGNVAAIELDLGRAPHFKTSP